MLLQEILQAAGVDYRTTTQANEVVLCCPFCVLRGFPDDTKFHLGLNIKLGLAHCFRCDWKSRNVLHTARQLARIYKLSLRLNYVPEVKAEKEEVEKFEQVASGYPEEYEAFGKGDDNVERRCRSYLRSRGITTLQILRHKIGYAAVGRFAWRVIFPVFDIDGQVYGAVARAIDTKQSPKYLNTPGIKLMWNAHRQATVAVVCEGIMDALAVERALMRKHDWIAVARLGSSITHVQLKQLKRFDKIVILPDWDKAGVTGANELALQCAEGGLRVDVAVPEVMDGRDPGSMTEDEILAYIDTAGPWRDTYVRNDLRLRAAAVKEAV